MPYIGKSPSVGLRTRYNYTATAGQTSFTGADNNNVTLTYTDTNYSDVYLNGTLLLAVTDYASTTGTSIVLTSGASLNDVLEVVVYDIFSVADTVSATDGGTFKGNVNFSGAIDVDGTTNLDVVDIDGAVDMASTLAVTGAATFTSSVTTNNLEVNGFFAGETSASTGYFDFASGSTRITSKGADGDTLGAFAILQQASDGSPARTAFNIASDGSLSTPTLGTSNVRFGVNAGNSIASGGIYNVVVGDEAGTAITTGDRSVAVGYAALSTDTTGNKTVAVGVGALATQLISGDTFNTAVGFAAGNVVSTGTYNTFVGGLAGDGTDDGAACVAVGYSALSGNCGSYNTAIGTSTIAATTGEGNTALGYAAGFAVTSGSNNSFFGRDAGRTGSPGGNITTASNQIVLGDENITHAYIKVDWTVGSDARDKTDFTPLDLGLDFVNALAPVTYKWDKRSKYGDKTADDYDLLDQTPDGTHKEDWLDIGFKAQEVQTLEEAAGYTTAAKKNLTVSTSGDGKQMGLQYSKFVPILVKAMQEQNALIEALTARIATLEG